MRYVIGICLLTSLIIWDGFRNDGRYLDLALRSVSSLVRSVIG
jgi:hypothetical protein